MDPALLCSSFFLPPTWYDDCTPLENDHTGYTLVSPHMLHTTPEYYDGFSQVIAPDTLNATITDEPTELFSEIEEEKTEELQDQQFPLPNHEAMTTTTVVTMQSENLPAPTTQTLPVNMEDESTETQNNMDSDDQAYDSQYIDDEQSEISNSSDSEFEDPGDQTDDSAHEEIVSRKRKQSKARAKSSRTQNTTGRTRKYNVKKCEMPFREFRQKIAPEWVAAVMRRDRPERELMKEFQEKYPTTAVRFTIHSIYAIRNGVTFNQYSGLPVPKRPPPKPRTAPYKRNPNLTDEKYDEIKAFISANPHVPLEEVLAKYKVSKRQLRYMQEKRKKRAASATTTNTSSTSSDIVSNTGS